MGIRFKKRIKLFKGVYLNVGKKGISSVSMGGKGVTVSSSGRVTTSLPGTGISYTSSISSNKAASNAQGKRSRNENTNYDSVKQSSINEDKVDFESVNDIVSYYLPKDYDLSSIQEKKFNKIWIVIWIILSVLTGGLLLLLLVPIYLYLYLKNKSDYRKELKAINELDEKINDGRVKLTSYINDIVSVHGFDDTRKIVARHVWIGETKEQLVMSLGEPEKSDETVLKTKIKNSYFYYPINAKSYAVKVYLEDGVVAGWDKK